MNEGSQEVEVPIDEIEHNTYLLLGHFKRNLDDVVHVNACRNVDGEFSLSLAMNNGDTLLWSATKTLHGMYLRRPSKSPGRGPKISKAEKQRRKLKVENERLQANPKVKAKLLLLPDN